MYPNRNILNTNAIDQNEYQSMDANLNEAMKWFRQGERDLVSARNSLSTSDYNWACFQAQQSAEKSLKAILYGKGI